MTTEVEALVNWVTSDEYDPLFHLYKVQYDEANPDNWHKNGDLADFSVVFEHLGIPVCMPEGFVKVAMRVMLELMLFGKSQHDGYTQFHSWIKEHEEVVTEAYYTLHNTSHVEIGL